MAVEVGSAYGQIVIDTSAIERAVAAAQGSLRGLDSIDFGAGISGGVAVAATAVTGLQQTVMGLGTAGAGALRNLSTQLANLTANTADGLGLTSLGTQIDTIQAKVQNGFLTIKDNVTLAVTNFRWADYINPLTWPTVPAFHWVDYVGPLSWPTLPAIGWTDYINPLTWPTVPAFHWVDYIGPLTWPTIPAIGWSDYINPLTWPTVPAFQWADYISPLSWPTLPRFGWNEFIGGFAWPTLPAFSWANLVPPFVWPSLPSFRWSDFISRFSWPSLPTIPGFATGGVAPGGLARVAEQGAEVLRFPGGQGLATVTREMVLPLPAGTEIYNHAQSMAMLRELFGAGATNGTNGTNGANARTTVLPATLAAAPMAKPADVITINATINHQADAEHLFRRIQRLQERRA